jgi:hypothetical protein
MKTKTDIRLIFVFVMLAVLSSCAPAGTAPLVGEVVSLAPGSVMYGIRAVIAHAPGASALTDGTRYLFVWCYQGGSAGFFAIDSLGNPLEIREALRAGGNLANVQSVSEIVASLRAGGWRDVAPGAVPAALVELAGSRLVAAPVMILTVGTFPGGFNAWFNATFYPQEVTG